MNRRGQNQRRGHGRGQDQGRASNATALRRGETTAGAASTQNRPPTTPGGPPLQNPWGTVQGGQSGCVSCSSPQNVFAAWNSPQGVGGSEQRTTKSKASGAWSSPLSVGGNNSVATKKASGAWGPHLGVGGGDPSATTSKASVAWGDPGAMTSKATEAGGLQIGVAGSDSAASSSKSDGHVKKESARNATSTVAEGRGSLRGRRMITEVVRSRSAKCSSKSGQNGRPINVEANYFHVTKKMNWTIYQYRVDFSPEVESPRAKRRFLVEHQEHFGGYIFDGTMLFTAQHIKNEKMELISRIDDNVYKITVKYVGIVDNTDVQTLQVLNLILRRAMEGLNLQLVGRNFFDPVAKIVMGQHRLEIWPGYTTSIRQHEQDILLCCEVAHKVMRTETLYDILMRCVQNSHNYQDPFKRQVIGTIVLTDYNNKTYRVDDVDFQVTPQSTFATEDGAISYAEYYNRRYHIPIRDMKQPMLVSRPTEKNLRGGQSKFIMLVPELCRATGITDDMRANMRLMRDMADCTRLTPERRIERLLAFNRRLLSAQASTDVLKSWNMQLDSNLVQIPGRVLDGEEIFFGNNKTYRCNNQADWTREFRNNLMQKTENLMRWCVITPTRNIKEVQNFVQMCIRAGKGMGMNISPPQFEEIRDDRTNTYSRAIENASSRDPRMLMIILPNKNEEKYSCVKKKCCIDRPVPSQVCVLTTIAPRAERSAGLMSVATKVVIQMNAKLGGTPWLVDVPLPGLMVVGFDVCHSAKERNKSYGALVASLNIKTSGRYYSTVMEHQKYQELSNEISMHMAYALYAYKEVNGVLPQRIVFYRDGVGDGQLHQVFQAELNHLREKLTEIYRSSGVTTDCKLSFIVVSKRINTRYFVNRQNPDPGTVVDDIITLPERYDFFLVSQSVRQGTVSPTSYNILFDNSGLSPDRLQMLTYKMTHLYYNWSGTCRVPAVCQYAHKLAFLVAESLHRCPSTALDKLLYFL